jgi:cytochrome c peroxidase
MRVGWKNGSYADQGRYGVTNDPADIGLFKTPPLHNVAERPFLPDES